MKSKIYFLSIISILFLLNEVKASDYYWVGGNGNWSDFATHWATTSGGSTFHNQVPQSVDNVYFDSNSFSASGEIVTIDQTIVNCGDMTWSGAMNQSTLDGSYLNTLRIYGSLTFISAMNLSYTGPVYFEATSMGKTITSAGKSFSGTVTFNGIGGGWTLQDDFTTTSYLNLNNGTLTSNNQTVNANIFNSNTSTSRTLNMGSSTFNISWYAGPGFWNVSAAGMTLNCGTSTINATANQQGWTPYFYGAGLTYYNLNFTGTLAAGGAIQDNNIFHDVFFATDGTINGNNTFHDVLISGNGNINGDNTYHNLTFSPGYTYTLYSGKTQTINSTLNATGNCGALIAIKTSTSGSPSTFSHAAGSVIVSFVSLKDINAVGGASFTANSSVDLGNNSGWTINAVTPQNLYWIGNGGNWNDGNHWSTSSGGSPSGCSPTPVDNVFFDVNSFSLAAQTVSINVPTAYCNNMTWSGASNQPTLDGSYLNTLRIYGSLTFISAMNLSFSGPVYFEATSMGKTITSAGKSFSGTVTFNGIGGGWTLQDDFTTTSYLNLNNGTLTSNNQTVNANIFNSNTSTSRTLNMGSSTFNISWYAGPGFWNVSAAGMTLNCGTSTINATANQQGWTPYFYGAGLTYYNLNFTGTLAAGGAIQDNNIFHDVFFATDGTINGNNTFHDVLISGNGNINGDNTYHNLTFSPGYTYTLYSGKTQTINSTLNATGNCGALIAIKTSTSGSPSTFSHAAGSVIVSFVSLKDINAVGGASFTANSSVDLGNNSGWTINAVTPQNLYWIGNGGNWNDGNHWSTSSGGSPSGCSPTPVDNVFFDVNSFSLAAQTVSINVPTAYCNNMTWSGASNQPTLDGSYLNTLRIYGSLTFISAMNLSFSGPVYFEATSMGKTITSAGKSFSGTVTFNGIGGGWTLQDDFTTTSYLNLNNGTLTSNNQTVNANIFNSNTSTSRTLNMGSSTFNISWYAGPGFWNVSAAGMTLNCGTSTINATANQQGWTPYFYGAGLTYYNLNFTGTLAAGGAIQDNNIFHDVFFATDGTINGNNTFHDVLISGNGNINGDNTYHNLTFSPSYTYTLYMGKTQTILNDLNLTGTGGFPIRIQSSNIGFPSTFYKSSGTVCADFIRISDNTATGGAIFYAGPNSQDLGGNSGWDFSGGPAASVSISANPSGQICYGTPVEFTADTTNAGTSPVFNWYVNGTSQQNGTSNIFDDSTLVNGDVIYCVLTSNAYCYGGVQTNSDTIVMNIGSSANAGIIYANPDTICKTDSFALVVNGTSGNIQWQSSSTSTNFADIAGATDTIYSGIIFQTTYYRVVSGTGNCADTSQVFILYMMITPIAAFTNTVSGLQVDFNSGTSSGNITAYSWDFGDGTNSNSANPIHTYTSTGTFHVCLTVYNSPYCSSTVCNDVTVNDSASAVENLSAINQWNIYPDPVDDYLFVSNKTINNPVDRIEIFDVLGNKLLTKVFNKTIENPIRLDVSGLARGMYFLKIKTNETDYIKTVIKQ